MSSPFDGMDPQTLQRILGGNADQSILAAQLAQAQALAAPSQAQHTTGYGAGWSALGDALGAAVGGTRATGLQHQLAGSQAQSDHDFLATILGGGMAPKQPQPMAPAPAPVAPSPMPGAPGAPPRLLTPGAPRVAPPDVLLGRPAPAAQQLPAPAASPESRVDMERRLGFLGLATGRKDFGSALLQDAQFLTEREEKKGAEASGAKDKAIELEGHLRDKLAEHPEVRNALAARDFYQQMADAPNNGTGDLTRIYSLAKLLDPSGRVTDDDAKQAAKTGGLPGELQGLYNSVVSGGKLSPTVRADLAKEASRLVRVRVSGIEPLRKEARRIATDYGLNPTHVDIDLGFGAQSQPKAASGSKVAAGTVLSMPDGKKFRVLDDGVNTEMVP